MPWSLLACFPTPEIYSMSLYIEYDSLIDVVHVVRLEFVFVMHLRQIVESILRFTYLKFMPLARLVGSGRRTDAKESIFETRSTSLSLPSEFHPASGEVSGWPVRSSSMKCNITDFSGAPYYVFCDRFSCLHFFVTSHKTYGESRGKYLTHKGASDCCNNIHKPLWSSSIHFSHSCSHPSYTIISLR
jgi:hypothetical protein